MLCNTCVICLRMYFIECATPLYICGGTCITCWLISFSICLTELHMGTNICYFYEFDCLFYKNKIKNRRNIMFTSLSEESHYLVITYVGLLQCSIFTRLCLFMYIFSMSLKQFLEEFERWVCFVLYGCIFLTYIVWVHCIKIIL